MTRQPLGPRTPSNSQIRANQASASIKTALDQIKARLDSVDGHLASQPKVRRRFPQLGAKIGELHRGQVACERRLSELEARLAAGGTNQLVESQLADQFGHLKDEVETLYRDAMAAHNDLEKSLKLLEDRVDNHAARLASHAERLGLHDHQIGQLHETIRLVAGVFTWWQWVVAIVAGAIAYVWWAATDFTQKVGTGANAPVIVFPAEQWWAAFIAAFGAFAFVAFLITLFNARRVKRRVTREDQGVVDGEVGSADSINTTPPVTRTSVMQS